MAVRHGYGKIAGADALVFAYDTGDTVNSYKGEPTENLFLNPTFIGTSGTQTSTVADNWTFSGYTGDTGFKFHDNSSSPIPLKFPNEGAVITIGASDNNQNRRFYCSEVLEPGQTYSVSAWIYSTYSGGISIAHFEYGGANLNSDYFSSTANHPNHTVGEWYYWEDTYTVGADYTNGLIGPVFTGTLEHPLAVQRFQIEKKSHATPFVNGTRSATEGLKDLTGLGGINLANVSFDSNAQMTFDGTNDKIELGDLFDVADHFVDNQSFTIESVVNVKADNGVRSGIFSNQRFQSEPDPGGFGLSITISGETKFCMNISDSTPASYQGQCLMSIDFGELQHITYTYDSSAGTISAYRNGELQNTSTSALYNWTVPTDSTRTRIATNKQGGWGYYHEMDLPVVKCYNRALTSGEVKNNYSHYKNRFGI